MTLNSTSVITTDQFLELRDFIVKMCHSSGQTNVTRLDVALKLDAFSGKFDIGAMYRFKTWMETHGYDNDDIFITLVHDLKGYNDPCFLPRTSTY